MYYLKSYHSSDGESLIESFDKLEDAVKLMIQLYRPWYKLMYGRIVASPLRMEFRAHTWDMALYIDKDNRSK